MRKKSNREIFYITLICIVTVIILTVVTMLRSFLPSGDRPYEKLTPEEAREYMSYEAEYVVVDVRNPAEYGNGHLKGAVSLPYNHIVEEAEDIIPGKDETVYVYGSDPDQSSRAAQKLSDMGYTSVAEIGSYSEWTSYLSAPETEGILENELQ